MGWVMLALVGLTAAALLVVLRVPRALWPLMGAALMLGAAGYAWQGQPGLPANPVAADAVKLPPTPGYTAMRDTMFGRFGGESMYFAISDIGLKDGDTQFAASAVIGGTNYAPKNAAFWTELGNIIALHDDGHVSPASLLAFNRAMQVAPQHPGPPYFLGLAYIREGQYAAARPWWRHALALSPEGTSYRGEIAQRLAMLDALLAEMERRKAAPQP